MVKLYNTLTRKLENFIPVEDKKVSMYVCGPTVYNYIHIGNARPAIFFDTVRRYLEYKGYDVKYVQNFTDVDDKIINKAKDEGVDYKEITKKYIDAYFADTSKINLKEDGMIRPRATDYIGDMIDTIKILIDRDFAYESEGDVYFNVMNYRKKYGELSNKNVDDLIDGASGRTGAETAKKKHSVDFALWKNVEGSDSEDVYWESPWGNGRPGWHIECTAMSKKILGDTFDIHGGGQDLIFPHHENELAQSKCACDGNFANYWMHNGYINVKGEKMSKSANNFFLLRDVLKEYSGNVVRFFVLSSHYRKTIDFSDNELKQSKKALARIKRIADKIEAELISGAENKKSVEVNINSELEAKLIDNFNKKFVISREKFENSMDEDFNTAAAMGSIFEIVKEINKIFSIKSEEEKKNPNVKIINFYSNELRELLVDAKQWIENILDNVLGIKLIIEDEGNENSKISNPAMELSAEQVEKLAKYLIEIKPDANVKMSDVNDSNAKEIGNWVSEVLLEGIFAERLRLKKEKKYSEADAIREKLSAIGIEIKDGREGTTWKLIK